MRLDFAASARARVDELSQANGTLQIRLHELESWLADWLEEKALLTEEKSVLTEKLAQSQGDLRKWADGASIFLNDAKCCSHASQDGICVVEEGGSGRGKGIVRFSQEDFFTMLDEHLKEMRENFQRLEREKHTTANRQLQALAKETLSIIMDQESEAQILKAQANIAAEHKNCEDKILDKVLSLTEKLEEAEKRGNYSERRKLELEGWVEAWLQEKALLEDSLQHAFKIEQSLKLDIAVFEAQLSQVLGECDPLTDSTLHLFHALFSQWRFAQAACSYLNDNVHEASDFSVSLMQSLQQSQNEFSQALDTVASLQSELIGKNACIITSQLEMEAMRESLNNGTEMLRSQKNEIEVLRAAVKAQEDHVGSLSTSLTSIQNKVNSTVDHFSPGEIQLAPSSEGSAEISKIEILHRQLDHIHHKMQEHEASRTSHQSLRSELRKKEDQLAKAMSERSQYRAECQILSATVNEAVAHSTACTSALTNLFHKLQLSKSMRVWASSTVDGRQKKANASKAAARMFKRGLAVPFETWTTNLQYERHILQVLALAYQKANRRAKSLVFHAWKASAQKQQHLTRKAQSIVSKMLNRTLAVSFRAWCEHSSQQKRMRKVCSKIIKRISNQELFAAYFLWRENAAEQKSSKAKTTKIIWRMLNLRLAVVHDSWRSHVAEERKMKAKLVKIIQRWMKQGIATAFDNWRANAADQKGLKHDQVVQEKQMKAKALKVVQRLMKNCIASAFGRWIEHAVQEKELDLKSLRVVCRRRRLDLYIPFVSWLQHIENLKKAKKTQEILQQFSTRPRIRRSMSWSGSSIITSPRADSDDRLWRSLAQLYWAKVTSFVDTATRYYQLHDRTKQTREGSLGGHLFDATYTGFMHDHSVASRFELVHAIGQFADTNAARSRSNLFPVQVSTMQMSCFRTILFRLDL